MNLDNSLITFDVDWAPDWIIYQLIDELTSKAIKATWFVTHKSEAIKELEKYPELFEVGLHPNFLSGSSHGKTEKEVMATLKNWFPEAVSLRTHSLCQSERLLQMLCEEYQMEIDCSIFLRNCANIRPHSLLFSSDGAPLIRVPYFFQDNIEMNYKSNWDLNESRFKVGGLKVFNFHPLHIFLNSSDKRAYEKVKAMGNLRDIGREQVSGLQQKGNGVSTLFHSLLDSLNQKETANTILEIVKIWREGGADDI